MSEADPLRSYRYYSRAETARLREALGDDHSFIELEAEIKPLVS